MPAPPARRRPREGEKAATVRTEEGWREEAAGDAPVSPDLSQPALDREVREGEKAAAGRKGGRRRSPPAGRRTGGREYLRRRCPRVAARRREDEEASLGFCFARSRTGMKASLANIEPISRVGARHSAGTVLPSLGLVRYRARMSRFNVSAHPNSDIRYIRPRISRISNIKAESEHPNGEIGRAHV